MLIVKVLEVIIVDVIDVTTFILFEFIATLLVTVYEINFFYHGN